MMTLVLRISIDMCHKANHLLHVFSCCDPFVKTHLFKFFPLSLWSGATLWRSSFPQLKALEVSFNNILRKIWSLPHHSQTHRLALFILLLHVDFREFASWLIFVQESCLLLLYKRSNSTLMSDLFSECAHSAYTSIGYNILFGSKVDD